MIPALSLLLPLIWPPIVTDGRAIGVAIGVVAVLMVGTFALAEADGYGRASAAWEIKYQRREAELQRQRFAEIDRQASANAAAKAEEAKEIAALEARLQALGALAVQLADEAAKDPRAGDLCLDEEAVKRHNRRIAT